MKRWTGYGLSGKGTNNEHKEFRPMNRPGRVTLVGTAAVSTKRTDRAVARPVPEGRSEVHGPVGAVR